MEKPTLNGITLEESMDTETLKKLETEYLSWVGTPYVHMAKEKGVGADCALFLAMCLKNAGILTQVENLYYSRTWMQTGTQELMVDGFREHLKKYLVWGYEYKIIQFSAATKEGYKHQFDNFDFCKADILCFTTKKTVVCHHAGMYHEDNTMLHAYQGKGVYIAQILDHWKEKIRYVIRIL